jgi:hypothetical protein
MKIALTSVLFASSAVAAGASGIAVTLADGKVLEANAVRFEAGLYLLERSTGEVVSLPSGLVVEIRRSPSETYRLIPARHRAPSAPSARLAPPRRSPTETLAGYSARFTSASEQLEALGPPATFQQGPVDPHYQPRSDWDLGNLERFGGRDSPATDR